MELINTISANTNIDSVHKNDAQKETIWYNPDALNGTGAWQTLALVESNNNIGLKIFEQNASGEWNEANVMNAESEDDNFILICNNTSNFRFDAAFSKYGTLSDRDENQENFVTGAPLFYKDATRTSSFQHKPKGCLHVVFYDDGSCNGLGHTITPKSGASFKVPGIYHMVIQYMEKWEKMDESAIFENVWVKNFDFVNSSLNDKSGEEKGYSPWKNHWLVAPFFKDSDKSSLLTNDFSTGPIMDALNYQPGTHPMDNCTLDVVFPFDTVQGYNFNSFVDQQKKWKTHALNFNYLAKLGNVTTWDRICHTFALFGDDSTFDKWGPYKGLDDRLEVPWPWMARSQQVLDWCWGHSRTDIEAAAGVVTVGINDTKAAWAMEDEIDLGEIKGPGAGWANDEQTEYNFFHHSTWFGPRCGYDFSQGYIKPDYYGNAGGGATTNYWARFDYCSHLNPNLRAGEENEGPLIYNFFPDDFFEFSDLEKERFHCSIAAICGKFPQEALVIDENQTWKHWIEFSDNVGGPQILGFDYSTDPRASESVGFYAYQANGLAYGSHLEVPYNMVGGGTYINYFQQLFPTDSEYEGTQYGNSAWTLFRFNEVDIHPLLDNAIETQENERTFDYSRRRNLNVVENSDSPIITSVDDNVTNNYPEFDGNSAFYTSNFTDQKGITGRISIAVNQMSSFGDNAIGQENPDDQITEHWSILDKTQIFIGYITGENYFRHKDSFKELQDRQYHHGDLAEFDDAYGNRLRLIKLVLSAEEEEFYYTSELLNFNHSGSYENAYADSGENYLSEFGVWSNAKLQVDFGGDPRADYIIDNFPSNEEDEDYADDITYQKALNIYMSSNIAGYWDESSDGYNRLLKITVDLGESEDSLSHLITTPDYVRINNLPQVLYDRGTETDKIISILTTDDKDLIINYNKGWNFDGEFAQYNEAIASSSDKIIPLSIITTYINEPTEVSSNAFQYIKWHNYRRYFSIKNSNEINSLAGFCVYDSIKAANLLMKTENDLILEWKTPKIIYTTRVEGDLEYNQKIETVPTSYTIRRSINPILPSNYEVIGEILENNVMQAEETPGSMNSFIVTQDETVDYYYSISMNFDMPMPEFLGGGFSRISGVPTIVDSFRGIKTSVANSYLLNSSTQYAAIEKSEDTLHIGLGKEPSDTPKWAGVSNHTFMGSKDKKPKVLNAELLSPDVGTGLPLIDMFIKIDSEEKYLYGIKRGQPYIWRINKANGNTEKSNAIQNPNSSANFNIWCACEKKSEIGFIWAYSQDDEQVMHSIKVVGNSWSSLRCEPNADLTVGLRMRFSDLDFPWNYQYDSTYRRSFNDSNKKVQVSDIVETKQTSGGTSYYLWFILAPIDYDSPVHQDRGFTNGCVRGHTYTYADNNNNSTETDMAQISLNHLFAVNTTTNRRTTPHTEGASGAPDFTTTYGRWSWSSGDTLHQLVFEDKSPPTPSFIVYRNLETSVDVWNGTAQHNSYQFYMRTSRWGGSDKLAMFIWNNGQKADGTGPHITSRDGTISDKNKYYSDFREYGSNPTPTVESKYQGDTSELDWCNYIDFGYLNMTGIIRDYRDDADGETNWGYLSGAEGRRGYYPNYRVMHNTLVDTTHINNESGVHQVGFFVMPHNWHMIGRLQMKWIQDANANDGGYWQFEDNFEPGEDESGVDSCHKRFHNEPFMFLVKNTHKGSYAMGTQVGYPKIGFQAEFDNNGFLTKAHDGTGDYTAGMRDLSENSVKYAMPSSLGDSRGCHVQIRYGPTKLNGIDLLNDYWKVNTYDRTTAISTGAVRTSNEREVVITTSLKQAENDPPDTYIEKVYIDFNENNIDEGEGLCRMFYDPGATNTVNFNATATSTDTSDGSQLLTALGNAGTAGGYRYVGIQVPKIGPAHRNRTMIVLNRDTATADGSGAGHIAGDYSHVPGNTGASWSATNKQGAHSIKISTIGTNGITSYTDVRNAIVDDIVGDLASTFAYNLALTDSGASITLVGSTYGHNQNDSSNENGFFDNWGTENAQWSTGGTVSAATSSRLPVIVGPDNTYQYPAVILDTYSAGFSGVWDYIGYLLSRGGENSFGKFYINASTDVGLATPDDSIQIQTPISQINTKITFENGIVATATADNKFDEDSTYRYKLSFTYDGRQESPLTATTFEHEVQGTTSNRGLMSIKCNLKIAKKDMNSRVNRVNMYRIDNEDDLYRLVKSIKTDVGWTESGDFYEYSFFDEGKKLVSYEAFNGISENVSRSFVHWSLSTQINNQHVVANCRILETDEEVANYIFKSKTGKFDQFDWTKDYGILPGKPTAIKAFAGKIFAFDLNNTWVVNANDLRVMDTLEGMGCIGPRAIVVTDFGMCFFDHSNIYLHDGHRARAIGTKILYSGNSFENFEGWINRPNKENLSLHFDANRKQFIIFEAARLVKTGDEEI